MAIKDKLSKNATEKYNIWHSLWLQFIRRFIFPDQLWTIIQPVYIFNSLPILNVSNFYNP